MNTNTENRPLYIAFTSQKGGVGKTSVAELVASILHYKKGYKILVVDCDFPQLSFYNLRKRENLYLDKNEDVKERISSYQEKKNILPYDIVGYDESLEETFSFVDQILDDIDIVIVDTKGTLSDEDLSFLVPRLDYIFSPIEMDRQSIESSVSYGLSIERFIQSEKSKNNDVRIKGFYLFWNKFIKPATDKQLHVLQKLYKAIGVCGVPIMDTQIGNYNIVKKELDTCQGDLREVIRTTLLPPNHDKIRHTKFYAFVDELLSICKLNKDSDGGE